MLTHTCRRLLIAAPTAVAGEEDDEIIAKVGKGEDDAVLKILEAKIVGGGFR